MSTSFKVFNHSSKTYALSEHLAALALELGPDAKLPTIHELRRQLNVSVATLDNALSQLEGQKIIYRKHGVGIFVSPHIGKKSVALVCDPTFFRAGMSPFWQEIIEAMRIYGVDKGESCRFYLALPSAQGQLPVPDDLVEDVRAKRVDGVLFIGNNNPAVLWILEQDIPVVAFAGWSQWMVEINYSQIVRIGLSAIQERGCREVGFLIPYLPTTDGTYATAFKGLEIFEAQTRQQGLSSRPEWVWDIHRQPPQSLGTSPQEQGYNAILSMYESGLENGPKALLSTDDMMTRGALVAMQKLGIRLGHDVQIATHSNRGSTVLQGYESELIRLEVEPNAIVMAMFDCLKSLMASENKAPRTISIEPQIIR